MSTRPSDRLEELAHDLTLLAEQLRQTVATIKAEEDHDSDSPRRRATDRPQDR